MPNHAIYFKEYRKQLGFNNQSSAKDYLAAKDINPAIDYKYINSLNKRISDIIRKINATIHHSSRRSDSDILQFCGEHISNTYAVIKNSNIIPRLNNQGRRAEEVLFSWLRGFVVCEYFTQLIAKIFDIELNSIFHIGDDDIRNIETFRRTPTADLSIAINSRKTRIEVQSGFQGINDIKEHKVREAIRIYEEMNEPTICIHFDLYNGQVAFIKLDEIGDDSVNWITRQYVGDGLVWNIDQNFFFWDLENIPSPYQNIIESYYA